MSDYSDQYDESYFLRGRESGKSLYHDYRWLPELTIPMAEKIVTHCGINHKDKILDFGCARGYLVKAFRQLGYSAYGYDVSEWALENSDPEVYHHLTRLEHIAFGEGNPKYDWIIAKDVLEHCHFVKSVVNRLMSVAQKGVFAIVPLSTFDHGKYVVDEYELDVTHCQRYRLCTWAAIFIQPGWKVEVSYRVKGVKDNYAQHTRGNGFILAKRIEE